MKADKKDCIAKFAFKYITIVVIFLSSTYLVLNHHPTSFNATANLKEFTIELSCEFANDIEE